MDTAYDLSPSQKEQARHGERMFPLKRYVTVLSDLCPSVAAHWHEEAELTMITKGSCIYHIHLETYEAQAGDILRGEGYRGVRSAGFALRDWESENPFVAYMPVFEAAPAGGSAEYLAVSLETGGISRAAPPGGGEK